MNKYKNTKTFSVTLCGNWYSRHTGFKISAERGISSCHQMCSGPYTSTNYSISTPWQITYSLRPSIEILEGCFAFWSWLKWIGHSLFSCAYLNNCRKNEETSMWIEGTMIHFIVAHIYYAFHKHFYSKFKENNVHLSSQITTFFL